MPTATMPRLVATAGSNLRLAPYLRLRPARPGLVALGAAAGAAAFLAGGAIMALTQTLLPRAWVETFGQRAPSIVIAIGDQTAGVAEGVGLKVDAVSADHSVYGMLVTLSRYLGEEE